MADMYILQGSHNTGKTETLVAVIDILRRKYPGVTANFMINRKDKKVVFTNIKGTLKVGIETQGDPNSRLESSLNDFETMGCDIIFCACRTKGNTVAIVNAHSTKYILHFTSQTIVSSGFSANNAAVANSLVTTAGL